MPYLEYDGGQVVHEHVVPVPIVVPATEPLPIFEAEAGLVPIPVYVPVADPLPIPKAKAGSIPILVLVPDPVHVLGPEAEAKVNVDRGMPPI